jgi:hypothetical protein
MAGYRVNFTSYCDICRHNSEWFAGSGVSAYLVYRVQLLLVFINF